MKTRRTVLIVLLIISIGNFARITANKDIRTVETLTVLVIGALTAMLINEFRTTHKDE